MKTWMVLLVLSLAALSSSCGISGKDSAPDNPNKTDLEISNVQVAPTDSSTAVSWNTSTATVGTLAYGRSQNSLSTSLSSALAGVHHVTIPNLEQDTEYWYQITASDPLGPRVTTQPASFRTLISPDVNDTTAPVISDIAVVGITSSTATVTWKTDDRSRGTVFYGYSQSYGQSVTQPEPIVYSRVHSQILAGLSESSLYHFRIQAVNRPGKGAFSSDQTFQTAEPIVLEITNESGTSDTVHVVGNDDFKFSVRIRNAANIGGITFMIGYAPEVVEIRGVTDGRFYSENDGVLFLRESENPALGRIEYAASWKITFLNGTPVGTLANGGGEIAKITARTKGLGTSSPLLLVSTDESGDGKVETRLFDYNRTSIPFQIHNGVVIKQVK